MIQQRFGVLTSGGDCPGLNAVLYSIVGAAEKLGAEVLGFHDGFEGLLLPDSFTKLTAANTSGILKTGGTILGTTSRGHFCGKVTHGRKTEVPAPFVQQASQTCRDLGLDALIAIGGDGSMTIALQLYQAGFPIIGVPKTIDNDLEATSMTFGFDSAVACATDALDRLHTTAASHKRIILLQVMGRHAGWIALWSGLAGGADIILIPEIPFELEKIVDEIQRRTSQGNKSTMIVVAEGAKPMNGKESYKVNTRGEWQLGGIGEMLCQKIEKKTGQETRLCVLGHLQRGGAPTTLDRILGIRFGVKAVELALEKKFGTMVSYQDGIIRDVPLAHAVHRLKCVPPDDQIIEAAKGIGIFFGSSSL
ncbi:MAG: 6-phosphofructokinase [Verrucomicrobia bacterium]|nr:MAG: 6-phosphofructokinase [Verrucomicrobiota bacterium]